MFGNKTTKPQNRIDCLIGAGTVIEGDLTFDGGLRVDGRVHGSVMSVEGKPGTLVLSEEARIEGEIRVSHVVINGTVVGPVHAADYVELQSKANVTGDVYYKTLEMQLGAVVQGRLVYQDDAKAEKVVKLKPAAAE
ncbi:MAG: polymer-forming cytoskeletal protein [Betaproteobacteria bacterium]|jgi:cytoskeletal protein CcmA (bactofilin family)|nr:polymer-forming cytoskeletal protein [Betaproteobacteria bacterium]MDH4294115.1 polymer-forming cytoskeletal protein [Betaproteobacteria bacterium]MDH5341339.1 polymer-forming cytoskeletal protein [Betaproteobacteria bacterium]